MSDNILRVLDYGVVGLCAIMVFYAARVIYKEQNRKEDTKPGLLKLTYTFLGFCLALACINAYVQLQQQSEREKMLLLKEKLWDIEIALEDKGYTELASLAATQDPIIRERLEREISRLKEKVNDAQLLLKDIE